VGATMSAPAIIISSLVCITDVSKPRHNSVAQWFAISGSLLFKADQFLVY